MPVKTRGWRQHGRLHRVQATVTVERTGNSGPHAFVACARVGSGRSPTRSTECSTGRNPRVALAGAMRKLSKSLRSRKGAFRGMR